MHKVNRIIILRHGETDWNVDERLCSRTNVDLNQRGLRQAWIAGQALSGERVGQIVSSPLARALQTAKEAGKAMSELSESIPIVSDDRLRELDFGDMEGLRYSEMKDMGVFDEYQAWTRGLSDGQKFGGESVIDARDRVQNALLELCEEYSGTLLVVTHGHLARIFIVSFVLKCCFKTYRNLRLDNCRLADIWVEDGNFRLAGFNTLQLARAL